MSMQKIFAGLYIVTGIVLVVVFGGKLILQLLGMMVGFYMIWRGLLLLNKPMFFNANFRSFANDRFEKR